MAQYVIEDVPIVELAFVYNMYVRWPSSPSRPSRFPFEIVHPCSLIFTSSANDSTYESSIVNPPIELSISRTFISFHLFNGENVNRYPQNDT